MRTTAIQRMLEGYRATATGDRSTTCPVCQAPAGSHCAIADNGAVFVHKGRPRSSAQTSTPTEVTGAISLRQEGR